MTYKYPRERSNLKPETLDLINKLDSVSKDVWYNNFDACALNKTLLENLISQINRNAIPPRQLNDTISNKNQLETQISIQENELHSMLNDSTDTSELERLNRVAKLMINQGTVNIRPKEDNSPRVLNKRRT
ncbi:MAG: hypothetical protein IPL55_21585 [Saprospiraceae bacterium]|jgi:hypothetical protein|nr:hypothetical protein [Saprospiraceae bacterium]